MPVSIVEAHPSIKYASSEIKKGGFALDKTERRVVRQFVEALLFEKIVGYELVKRSSKDNLSSVRDCDADEVFDYYIKFKLGKSQYSAVGTISAFDRVRISEGSILVFMDDKALWLEARLKDVIADLDTDTENRSRVLSELEQTIELCRWNIENLNHHKIIRRDLDFQSLESVIYEGHLYHPCFKTRTGFSEHDHRLYGPEAGNHFQLLWLAVDRNKIVANYPFLERDFWIKELGEQEYKRLEKNLKLLGGEWDSYTLLPIHPWQFTSIFDLGLRVEISNRNILFLGFAGDFYQASQSLRTLINVSDPKKANVKVPMNVVCTSSHRNLQSHFVHTAPVISTWLQKLVSHDEYLNSKNNTLLLSEYAGLLFEPGEEHSLEGKIGVIFRESVVAKLEQGQAAVPFSSLMLTEADGLPFVHQWVFKHGLEAWLAQLIDTMLIPIWHLFVHQGIGFEAHSQNLILIHTNGWPEKIVLRDFHEDTEYVPEFLKDPTNQPMLTEVDPYFSSIPDNEGFAMSDIDAIRELFMDTVYVFNLADLAFIFNRHYEFSENQFWALVELKLQEYQSSGITSAERHKKAGTKSRHIKVESLLKKKLLNGGVLDYFEHTVSNPLMGDLK